MKGGPQCSNARGVTAGKAGHNAVMLGVSLRARWDATLVSRSNLLSISFLNSNQCAANSNNCSYFFSMRRALPFLSKRQTRNRYE